MLPVLAREGNPRVISAISDGHRMKLLKILRVSLLMLLASVGTFVQFVDASSPGYLSSLEKQVVQEINLARTNPDGYAAFLKELKLHFIGKTIVQPGNVHIKTQEGVTAVEEAIRFLRSVRPLPPLQPSRGMSLGARDHVRNTGPAGNLGHEGSNGSQADDRVSRYGSWQKRIGENISYGTYGARDIVMNLIVDDGVPSRGHRKNIFNPDYRVVGVACGYHATYKTMCVITFAAGYLEKKASD
jgi:uncharacterized protein YkwD